MIELRGKLEPYPNLMDARGRLIEELPQEERLTEAVGEAAKVVEPLGNLHEVRRPALRVVSRLPLHRYHIISGAVLKNASYGSGECRAVCIEIDLLVIAVDRAIEPDDSAVRRLPRCVNDLADSPRTTDLNPVDDPIELDESGLRDRLLQTNRDLTPSVACYYNCPRAKSSGVQRRTL